MIYIVNANQNTCLIDDRGNKSGPIEWMIDSQDETGYSSLDEYLADCEGAWKKMRNVPLRGCFNGYGYHAFRRVDAPGIMFLAEKQTEEERSAHMRALVRESGLTRAQVAEALGVSVAAVDAWMRPDDNEAHRTPPAMAIKIMESATKGKKKG